MRLPLFSTLLALTFSAGVHAEDATRLDQTAHINQIQVIGSHNSYHIAPETGVLELIAKGSTALAESLDYTHPSLAEQFTQQAIRQIELDVFADPQGGLYADPLACKLAKGVSPPVDPEGLLRKPGLKVLHVPDFDFKTTALTFIDALRQVRDWSAAHPGHVPILILVELKQEAVAAAFTQPVPFSAAELDGVDAEILSVFCREQLITPDQVRADQATLREAVTTVGWPTFAAARGKVFFALDNEGDLRDAYLKDHPALQGRVLFVTVAEDHPAAAFMKVNDAVQDFERIQRLVKSGFLVRTRADADTRQARQNDTSTRDKAFASGAQFISTDYPAPDARFSDYQVRFPNGVTARGNPLVGDKMWAGREFDAARSSTETP